MVAPLPPLFLYLILNVRIGRPVKVSIAPTCASLPPDATIRHNAGCFCGQGMLMDIFGVSVSVLLLAALACFIGAYVQTAIGFGMAVVAAPILFYLDPILVRVMGRAILVSRTRTPSIIVTAINRANDC